MENLRDLLCIRRIDRMSGAWVREFCGVKSGWVKELVKVFSFDLAILKEWRIVGMLKGYTMERVCVAV